MGEKIARVVVFAISMVPLAMGTVLGYLWACFVMGWRTGHEIEASTRDLL